MVVRAQTHLVRHASDSPTRSVQVVADSLLLIFVIYVLVSVQQPRLHFSCKASWLLRPVVGPEHDIHTAYAIVQKRMTTKTVLDAILWVCR